LRQELLRGDRIKKRAFLWAVLLLFTTVAIVVILVPPGGKAKFETSLAIFPPSFTLQSGQSTTLTAALTFGGSPLANKTISWSATTGFVSPSNGTTDASGQVSITYTVPSIAAHTSITASFAGDAEYLAIEASSSGVITLPPEGQLEVHFIAMSGKEMPSTSKRLPATTC